MTPIWVRVPTPWPEGSFARRHAQSAAFPALVEALRLAVEALKATHSWCAADGDGGGVSDPVRNMVGVQIAKIEALMAAEERDAYLSALARGMKMNDAARDECEGLRSAADALVRIVKILKGDVDALVAHVRALERGGK